MSPHRSEGIPAAREPAQCDFPAPPVLQYGLALHWAALVATMVLLTSFRAFSTSHIAGFIDIDDVAALRLAKVHYGLLWRILLALGVAYFGTLAAFLDFRFKRRAAPALAATAAFLVIATLIAGQNVPGGGGEVSLKSIFWLDWAGLGAAILGTWLQAHLILACDNENRLSGRCAATPHSPDRIALAYLLCSATALFYSAVSHTTFWYPALNSGKNYGRFFLPTQRAQAALVFFSTSALFASLAAVFGITILAVLGRFCRNGPLREGGSPHSHLRRAVLLGLAWSVIMMFPWQIQLLPEISLDQSWIFPAATLALGYLALTAPILLCGMALERDLDALPGASPRQAAPTSSNSELLFWSLLLFASYPFLRTAVVRSGSVQTARRRLLVFAGAHIAVLTCLAAVMDGWYNIPEWRGMYHGTLVPALQMFTSLLWAWLAYLWLEPRLPRARWLAAAAALLMAVFSSLPFWGWGSISRNVMARAFEYNRRHQFELRLLHWLFDRDRDGFAGLLHGSDPDDRNREVVAPGFHEPPRYAAAADKFFVSDPALARKFPNVVLLYLEGVAPRAISAYGFRRLTDHKGLPIPATPNIDAIRRDGALFTNARAHYPATWQGWLSINSGRNHNLGVLDYRSILMEKGHNGNMYKVLRLAGINRWCHPDLDPFANLFVPKDLLKDACGPGTGKMSTWVSRHEEKQGIWRGDKRAARLTDFIASLAPGDRFFLSEHMDDTHEPWAKTTLERARTLGFPQGLEIYGSDAVLTDGRRPEAMGRYFQAVTRMDAQIGRIIGALKERGLYESTAIILVGDHGYQWYENEQVQYVSFLYDPALRIPMIIKAPGLPKGIRVDQPVVQFDLLPTVMEMAGLKHQSGPRTLPLPGISLMPLLRGATNAAGAVRYSDRDVMLATYFDYQGILERFRHKLIFNRSVGTYLLFDLAQDPLESHNLADERPDLLKDLMMKYQRNMRLNEAYIAGEYPNAAAEH